MSEHPEYKRKVRRASFFGYTAIGFGVFSMFLPMLPGFVFILLGLSILSTQSRGAHQWLAALRARHPHLVEPLERLEMWVAEHLDITTHSHEYIRIPIRGERSVAALLEVSTIPGGHIAVIVHGASATMETPATQALAEAYRRRGCTVLRFDAYDGLGESAGTYATFTPTRFMEDLEDVLGWLKVQPWANGRIHLVGHSIGALVATVFASTHEEVVDELLLLAPTVSGAALRAAYEAQDPQALKDWETEGLKRVVHPLSEETYGLGYTFLEDALHYELTAYAESLTMPVRILRGTKDILTSLADCERLAEAIGTNATVVPVFDLPHSPTTRDEVRALLRAL